MTKRIKISLDAMGGDYAPNVVIHGMKIARIKLPYVDFLLFGDLIKLKPLLEQCPELTNCCQLYHTDKVVNNNDKPSHVLRHGKQSSMWLAIDAVARGEANGIVSAGNTGALMAISKHLLGMLHDVDRPAIAGFFPTERGKSVMLDLGANIDCNANNLIDFAVMGEMFARIIFNIENPTVGLLNVGSEETKGNDSIRATASILRQCNLPLTFYGFVEGNDIASGTVDVVVSDGFTGNIALKSAEGLSRLYTRFLRDALLSSWISRLGYLLVRSALRKVELKTDPRHYNGAVFLGLNGIAVKSHGGTDAIGFANAICVATELIVHDFNDRINQELDHIKTVRELSSKVITI
ncbi:MAG: phosphate acyltransferase PlsX [Rhodospirillaceae bacterium]|nr:phosphate acyltransferase PlsX [Rhodospirillaceae bacterium]